MSKNVIGHVLFDSPDLPPNTSLGYDGFGGRFAVEPRSAHPWYYPEKAGDYVLFCAPTAAEYGYAPLDMQFDFAEPGFITFWVAMSFVHTDQGGSLYGGGYDENTYSQQTIQDTIAFTWRQFWVPAKVGINHLSVAGVFDPAAPDSANAIWVSKIEAYEGDDAPPGQGPYTGGSPDDPRATSVVRALHDDQPASLPAGFTSTGVVEPFATHDPPFTYYGGDERFGVNVLYLDGIGPDTAHFEFALESDGFVRFIHNQNTYLDIALDGTNVVHEDRAGYNPSAKQYPLSAGAHALDWSFTTYGDPSPQKAYRISRVDVWTMAPPDDLDTTTAALAGVGGTPGGGTPATGAYARSEFVRHKGGLYLARVDSPTTEPGPGDTADWIEMVAQPAAASANPFDALVRATVGADQTPFAPGEEGLWIVLNEDRTAVTDLRWQARE